MNLLMTILLALGASADASTIDMESILGNDLDMEKLMNMEGFDLSALLGGNPGMQQDLDDVEFDVKQGFRQDEPDLDPSTLQLDELDTMQDTEQLYEFKAETSRLMDIIVNSLYSNREVFLRELISNAADALSKLKHVKLSKGDVLDHQLAIYIEPDKKNGTLSIFDNGVGMSKDELAQNLGTIAKSGSHSFLEALAEGGDINVIGQFGVGFYSAFLVADDVIVQSKTSSSDEEYAWRSQASEGFTISRVTTPDIEGSGTRVTLILKPDASKFASVDTVERLIRQHSEFIDYPVYLKNKGLWVHINPAKPIWQRPKDEVTEEEYNKFYKKLSKDYRNPLKSVHYNGEGEVDFKSILYIPDDKDPTLFNQNGVGASENVKLYSHGVLVSNEKGLLPPWLSFVHGVVESNDLPLKVDREQLSNSKAVKLITKRLTKKVIDTFLQIMKQENDTADRLWAHYKSNLFLGCIVEDDNSLKDKISKMFRFEHLLSDPESPTYMNFAHYPHHDTIEGDPIYYMWTNNPAESKHSPILEIFKRMEIDVLLINGTIVDQCMEVLGEVNGRKLISVEREDVEKLLQDEIDEETELARSRMMKPFLDSLTDVIKKSGYSTFSNVELSNKLVSSPSAIFTSGTGVTAAQEKHIRNQSWFDESEMGWRLGKKVLSVNASHPIVKSLFNQFKESGSESEKFARGARMLYDFALLSGGHHLEMPELMSYLLKDSMMRDLDISGTDAENFEALEVPQDFYEEEDDEEVDEEVEDVSSKTDTQLAENDEL